MNSKDIHDYLISREGRKEFFNTIDIEKNNDIISTKELSSSIISNMIMNQLLINDEEYIKWVELFLNDFGFIDNSSDLIKFLSVDNQEHISKLSTFFITLNRKLEDNYFEPMENGGYYKIKYNDKGYLFGINLGEQKCCYIWQSDNPTEEFLDYDNLKLDTVKRIRK